jgi:hypothetical protein
MDCTATFPKMADAHVLISIYFTLGMSYKEILQFMAGHGHILSMQSSQEVNNGPEATPGGNHISLQCHWWWTLCACKLKQNRVITRKNCVITQMKWRYYAKNLHYFAKKMCYFAKRFALFRNNLCFNTIANAL